MDKKCLYVGNLPHSCDEDRLRALVAETGREAASVSIAMDRRTGRSRGFGFVEMGSEEDAEAALASLKDSSLEGRDLRLGFAYRDKNEPAPPAQYEPREMRPRRRRR